MDPQTGLSRALLLLLFLHLMPLGGRSHPLGGPSPGPPLELSRVQELRDHLPGTVGEWQEEQTAPEPLQQGRSSKAAGVARQAASAAGLGPRDHVLQSPKRMRDSGCFGGRMDRIGSSTGLGCNAAKTEGGVTRAATIPFTDRKLSIQEMDCSKASNIQIG